MTPAELSFALTLGLISGLHCLQMCGPIALVVGAGRPLALYNTGRVVTYTALGALAGSAGKALVFLGRPASIFTGAAMIVAGVLMIGFVPAKGLITIQRRGRFSKLAGGLLRAGRNRFLLGLTLGFLPCGLVYAALLKAMDSAGALAGAATMLAFGAGTSVALFAVGYGASFCGRWMTRLAPISVMLAGAVQVCGESRALTAMANWHRVRKAVHLACFLVFLALPFLNVVRFDIPRQRFYFFGYELWIDEFVIVFFALMFLMFLVVASSVFYGRVYCGYLCPQMIFSEASTAFESRLRRMMVKRGYSRQAARLLFYASLAVASVALAFVFMAYFVEPRDLLHRLLSLDFHTAAGIAGAAVTAVTFLDFTLVRERFCATACPYGYLQGMLGDGNTLLVHYRDESSACIECKKCVRVCPMGIDIRKSPFQIECIHCAECVDACDEVLGRLRQPGLIHYAWGEHGPLAKAQRQPWDARRVVVLLIVLFYGGGLFTALGIRKPLLARVAPDRSVMYRVAPDGRISNRFRYTLANRGKTAATVGFAVRDLPGAKLSNGAVALRPGESRHGEFDISIAPSKRADVVTHFTIVAGPETIPMTFLAPVEAK